MRMHPTGGAVRAVLWSVGLGAVTLSQIAAMVLAVQQRDSVGLLPSVVFLEVIAAALVILIVVALSRIPRGLVRTQRTLRAALQGDDARAPRTLAPLHPQGALGFGEQIALVRTRSWAAIWRSTRASFILVVFIIVLGSIVPAFYILPAIAAASAAAPWLDTWGSAIAYAIVLLPILLGLVLVVAVILDGARGRQITLTADDRGISQRDGFGRTRFIPWDDVRAVVRASGLQSDPLLNQYALWGERHGLTINLTDVGELVLPQQALKPMTTYGGGRERYLADAQRLLATIAARVNVPLRVYAAGYYAVRPRRPAALVVGLTTADLAALPPAPPPVPLPSPFIQQMWATTGRLTLATRTQAALLQVGRSFLGIAFVLLLVVFVIITANSDISANALSLTLVVIYGCIPFILVGTILSAIGRRQARRSALTVATADAQALRLAPSLAAFEQKRNVITIPWGRIRAWGLIPPAPSAPTDAIYVILWDGPTVAWVERAGAPLAVPGLVGDARDAYRQVAEHLRAMVAERTGLAPKLLPQPRSRR
jgi:hypothetical protein